MNSILNNFLVHFYPSPSQFNFHSSKLSSSIYIIPPITTPLVLIITLSKEKVSLHWRPFVNNIPLLLPTSIDVVLHYYHSSNMVGHIKHSSTFHCPHNSGSIIILYQMYPKKELPIHRMNTSYAQTQSTCYPHSQLIYQ